MKAETLFNKLEESAQEWVENGYPCENYPLIGEILAYQFESQDNPRILRYLRDPQFLALSVYWYIRLVLGTKISPHRLSPHIIDIYEHYYGDNKKLFFSSLGINLTGDALRYAKKLDVIRDIKNDMSFVKQHNLEALHESLNLDYPSYILALAMGAGKTTLIGSIIASEFAMSLEYDGNSTDGRFMRNALVFAPGTTIIESLRELVDLPYDKILPPSVLNSFLANLKIEFLSKQREVQSQSGSSYNLIVTNSEKISLRVSSRKKNEMLIKDDLLKANLRLQKLSSLPNIGVFSDEAHHTYGNTTDEYKRMRETVDYIAKKTSTVAVINTTGTPYYKNQTLKDVIVWYGLERGIKDNILKSLYKGIHQYDMGEHSVDAVIEDIIKTFFNVYGDVKLPDGAKAKIAFYFKTQEHLNESLPVIQRVMAEIGEDVGQIVSNTQKSGLKEVARFNELNDPSNLSRVILLIGKGVEGWNCPSLFACALIKEQTKSSNYVLQSAARCLRQSFGNEHPAKIFLDSKNAAILNGELAKKYGTSLGSFEETKVEKKTIPIRIRKTTLPKLEIRRRVTKVVHTKRISAPLVLVKPNPDELSVTLRSILTPNFINGRLELMVTGEVDILPLDEEFTDYHEVAHELSRKYHIPLRSLVEQLDALYPCGKIPNNQLIGLFNQVEKWQANYETVVETVKEVMALIKLHDESGKLLFQKDDDGYFTHIIRLSDETYNRMIKHDLLVHNDSRDDAHDLSFHYTPYNFDSIPERKLFDMILNILRIEYAEVNAFLFVGGLTDERKTDFHFEYKGEDGRYHRYFPDFVLVKKTGEFHIIEVKSERDRGSNIVEAKSKAVERLRKLQPDKVKYSVIYTSTDIIGSDKIEPISNWIGESNEKEIP